MRRVPRGGTDVLTGGRPPQGLCRCSWVTIAHVKKDVFRSLREWVRRLYRFRGWYCFVARELHDFVCHMSAEVGVTAVPSFVCRRVDVENEAIDHRVGAARPEGASRRWATREAGFVPNGVCAECAFDVRHSGKD